jgi:purine-binding chemotaxis protein CheW
MAQDLAIAATRDVALVDEDNQDFVTFQIGRQLFGVPILKVQDILKPENIAPVPLAPSAIRGSINLRGRIVTVIDVRERLGVGPNTDENYDPMAVTVERDHDLYTLLVDTIGDVVSLSMDRYEKNPSTLDPTWRQFASGVFRLDGRLMVVLDIERLLDIQYEPEAKAS